MTTTAPAHIPELEHPGPIKLWLLAARPRTLTAAVVPIAVGTALAYAHGHPDYICAIMALLAAMFIQIGTNFANDLFDALRGADDAGRLGPMRVTSAGLVTHRQITVATILAFLLAFACGLYLVATAGWLVLAVGLLSIACGVAYTGGPFPLAYNGLGDVFVFIFFGLVATAGTYYVQTLTLHPMALVYGTPVGLLAMAILIVNNLRDIDTDKRHRKITTAVLLGASRTRVFYTATIVAAYLMIVMAVLTGHAPIAALLMLASLPIAALLIRDIHRLQGADLNAVLGRTAKLQLISGLLLAAGVAL